jgi:hypothetical protein
MLLLISRSGLYAAVAVVIVVLVVEEAGMVFVVGLLLAVVVVAMVVVVCLADQFAYSGFFRSLDKLIQLHLLPKACFPTPFVLNSVSPKMSHSRTRHLACGVTWNTYVFLSRWHPQYSNIRRLCNWLLRFTAQDIKTLVNITKGRSSQAHLQFEYPPEISHLEIFLTFLSPSCP